MQSPPELGHSIAARRIFLVDPEHSMLVGVKRDRLAITIQIGPRRLEIIKRRLRLHKLQMHQPARRVVDIDQQRALRAARLEPPMLRSVDLDQLANAIPTMPRLMHRPHPLPTILPQPGHHHPLPDRLTRKSNAVQFRELLASKRRPEVRIALADDPGHFSPQNPRIATVAWLPASARRQSSRAALPKCLRQPQHLATAKPNQCYCLRNPDPLLSQIAQYIHPIDLRTAHQNHRHRPPAPHPIRKPGRVTSLSGPTVTSLSGVYMWFRLRHTVEKINASPLSEAKKVRALTRRETFVRIISSAVGFAPNRCEKEPPARVSRSFQSHARTVPPERVVV